MKTNLKQNENKKISKRKQNENTSNDVNVYVSNYDNNYAVNVNGNVNNNKKLYGKFQNVKLTDEEYDKLKNQFSDYEEKIDNLACYIKSKGDKYKSHYATILNWYRKESQNMPSWWGKDFKEEINEERKKLAEAINNGTYRP